MAGLPGYRRVEPGRQVSANDLNKIANDVAAGTVFQGFTAGLVGRPTPFGTYINPANPPPILAIIGGDEGGSGHSGSSISRDQTSAYSWVEAQWVVDGNDYRVEAVTNGLKGDPITLPAMEANSIAGVPSGYVAYLYPFGAPDFYYFWYDGESGNGSGIPITITCSDGSHHTATISGDSIVVS